MLGVPVDAYQHHCVAWLDRYRGGLGLDLQDFHRVYALGVALAARAPIWMGGAPETERSAHVDGYAAATISRVFAALRNHDVTTHDSRQLKGIERNA